MLNESMHKAQDCDSVSTTSSCSFCLGKLHLVHFFFPHSQYRLEMASAKKNNEDRVANQHQI